MFVHWQKEQRVSRFDSKNFPVTKPHEGISVDLTNMTAGQGVNRYVLTVIDNYSCFVKLYGLKRKTT